MAGNPKQQFKLWRYQVWEDGTCTVFNQRNEVVADNVPDEDTARLIAGAPDLKGSLITLGAFGHVQIGRTPLNEVFREQFDRAREAITKTDPDK